MLLQVSALTLIHELASEALLDTATFDFYSTLSRIRSTRIHITMASDNPNKGFPQFSDGDVFLIVSTRKAYKLHSQVLRRVSTYFRDIFDTKPAVKLTAAARRDGHIPWRFVLVQKSGLLSDRGQFVHQVRKPALMNSGERQ